MIKDIFGNKRYKVALHQHTTISDGLKTPEQVVDIYKEAGYDAVAITDHWKYFQGKEMRGITVISGCEYNIGASDTSLDVMHIVGIGMNFEPDLCKGNTRQEIINGIKKAGGLAILAHPAWSLNSPSEALALEGFSGVEIYNSVSNVNQSSRPYSGYFVDLLANEGVAFPIIAADDSHYYNGEDECKSFVMVKAESSSEEHILDAIKRGDFYATTGPELHLYRKGDKMIINSSECVMLNFLSNSAWAPDRIIRGEKITYAEYQIKPWDKWVRAEAKDADGRYAWSSVIFIDRE